MVTNKCQVEKTLQTMALTDDSSWDEVDVRNDGFGQKEEQASIDNPQQKEEHASIGIEVNGPQLTSANLEEHDKSNSGSKPETKNDSSDDDGVASETETKIPTEVGAGMIFGFSGLILGGPILALLAGVGATYAASNDEGAMGEAARASGDFAITTGSKVGEAAKEANEKHGVVDKIKNACASGLNSVKKLDEEHRASEKAKETLSKVGQKTVEFERKHHVVESILEGIQNGANFLLEKLRDRTANENRNETISS